MLVSTINEAVGDSQLTATTRDQYSVALEWEAPSPPPNKSIIDYEIRYKETTGNYITFNDGVSLNTYVTVTGLKKGTPYFFQVKAILSPSGQSNVGEVTAATPNIQERYYSLPNIAGIGIYKIKLSDSSDNSYLESGSYTRKLGAGFENYFPYSKFSDNIDSENYGTINYEKAGQYFYTDTYATSTSTIFGEVNQPIQVQVRILDENDISKVRHLSFYTDVRGDTSAKQFSNAYVIFDDNKVAKIYDPSGLFKDVKVNFSIENGELWIILDFIFAKPMKKSDILLESWNEGRTPTYAKIVDAWEISESKQSTKIKEETFPLNAEIEFSNSASPACKADNSCFAPYETKIRAGGTVTWINKDSFIHRITNGVPEKGKDQFHLFDSYINPGRSYQYTFNTSGKYDYYCEIHPWAQGIVIVFDENQASPIQNPISEPALIVKSLASGGSLLIKNDDTVYLADRSLKIEISGHAEGATRAEVVDVMIKRPDKSFEKLKAITNKQGDYETLTALDKKWQSGSYTIVAQYQKKIIGNISFVIVESR